MTTNTDFPKPPDPDYYIWANELVFPSVLDRNVPIWRYMDIAKFLSLLDKQSLFFSRLDHLGDPFEGSLTRQRELARREIPGLHEDTKKI